MMSLAEHIEFVQEELRSFEAASLLVSSDLQRWKRLKALHETLVALSGGQTNAHEVADLDTALRDLLDVAVKAMRLASRLTHLPQYAEVFAVTSMAVMEAEKAVRLLEMAHESMDVQGLSP